MTQLHLLWLPILLSSVIVFIVSSIIHMLSPWHKNDYPKLSNEEKVLDALRPLDIPQGEYMMPRPSSREEMKSPEFDDVDFLGRRPHQLNRNVGLQSKHIHRPHRAGELHHELGIGTLEFHQLCPDPRRPQPLGDG